VRSATHDALRALATPLPLPWPVRAPRALRCGARTLRARCVAGLHAAACARAAQRALTPLRRASRAPLRHQN
jgi:hypothetical protein